uniref:Uncharacterized protein n=1 Tax=Peronospora matthiolae TaxID=2874970 RepID=A0AAV1VC36_9STRA
MDLGLGPTRSSGREARGGYLEVADQPVELQQSADGIRWFFTTHLPELSTNSDEDRSVWALRLRRHGVVFYSHPGHHGFPWAVAESVANLAIRKAISRLAFTFHKDFLQSHCDRWCGVWRPSVTSISGSGLPQTKTRHTFGSMTMAFPTIRSGRVTV